MEGGSKIHGPVQYPYSISRSGYGYGRGYAIPTAQVKRADIDTVNTCFLTFFGVIAGTVRE